MIETTHTRGNVKQVDASKLTADEITAGVKTHGQRMGSFAYYIVDETRR